MKLQLNNTTDRQLMFRLVRLTEAAIPADVADMQWKFIKTVSQEITVENVYEKIIELQSMTPAEKHTVTMTDDGLILDMESPEDNEFLQKVMIWMEEMEEVAAEAYALVPFFKLFSAKKKTIKERIALEEMTEKEKEIVAIANKMVEEQGLEKLREAFPQSAGHPSIRVVEYLSKKYDVAPGFASRLTAAAKEQYSQTR